MLNSLWLNISIKYLLTNDINYLSLYNITTRNKRFYIGYFQHTTSIYDRRRWRRRKKEKPILRQLLKTDVEMLGILRWLRLNDQCRMLSILRRSLTYDHLRMVTILYRSLQNRCRMLSILRRCLTRDHLRMVTILHRSFQNRCKMSFFF